MNLKNKSILVTGGSRGIGLGLVEALVARGADVTVVARPSEALEAVKARFGVATTPGDVTDQAAAQQIVGEIKPDILVLNAGTPPPMAPIDQISWADFTTTWDHDVKAGLYWVQAALNAPLKPASRVLVTSSGGAIGGSPMSGGYGGAKRMLWFIAHYANTLAEQKVLGIRFQTLIPRQMVAGTGTGDAGSIAYAQAMGITQDAFLARFGAPMTALDFGDMVATILEDEKYAEPMAFGLKADTGITPIEGFGV